MMSADHRLLTPMKSRPAREIPRSNLERITEVIALLGVALTVALPIYFWRMLPDRVPTHWGASGQPDAWGPKVWVLGLPVISMGLYLSLSVLARFPHRFNYPWRITPENAQAQYRCARWLVLGLKTAMVWIFEWITWRMIQISLGNADGLGKAFLPLALVGICGIIGLYFLWSYRCR